MKRIGKAPHINFFVALFLSAALILAAAEYNGRISDRLALSVKEWQSPEHEMTASLWLPGYEVEIEALPVKGIDSNLSGLTWNQDTKTLFAVVNYPPRVVELSTRGEVLRTVNLLGFDDTEAIEYLGCNSYIVADERRQKLVNITIDAQTVEIKRSEHQQLSLGMGTDDNKGIEGLAWDAMNRRLYVAKEQNPVHIYELTGFPLNIRQPVNIEVKSNSRRDKSLFVKDVSGLDFNRQYRRLLVLSDESKILLEVDMSGRLVGGMSLKSGHGLRRPVPQPEGIATDGENNLYLVSEPNLFYVFKQKKE